MQALVVNGEVHTPFALDNYIKDEPIADDEEISSLSLTPVRCEHGQDPAILPRAVNSANLNEAKFKESLMRLEPLVCVSEKCGGACLGTGSMRRCFSSENTTALAGPEVVEESIGADGDAYRFRYNKFSPEEAYSPIAGVAPFYHTSSMDKSEHVFSTHEDADGAICSEPIHGPLTLIVRAADGSDYTFQVVDGMCVKNLKEKIWNITGVSPRLQRIVLPDGGVAPDAMPFAGSGMRQFDVLYLKIDS